MLFLKQTRHNLSAIVCRMFSITVALWMQVDATPNSANEKQINTQTTLVRLDYFMFLILVFGSFVLFAKLGNMCFHG